MKRIEINGNKYNLYTLFDEIPLNTYCEYLKIITEREYHNVAMADGSVQKIPIDKNDESIEFNESKDKKIIGCLSDIPEEYLDEITPMIIDYVDIKESNDLKKSNEFSKNGVKYIIKPLQFWTFQQFADFENLVYKDFMNFFTLMFWEKNDIYDRFHRERQEKYNFFSGFLAKDCIGTMYQYFSEMNLLKSAYNFVFDPPDTGDVGTSNNIQKHLDNFGWEDTIISIASSQSAIFSHPKGTLYAVRTANVLDVLDYLNVKTSRDIAEKLDYKSKQQKNERDN